MHVPVAAATGAAAGAGTWLFSYNRENFQFDAGLRFQRFMAARGFANAQTGQYREDIQGLAEMTVAKMDTWQAVCTLFLCVCAALSCAGRLGMHGAAPPGWLCALYSGNIFCGILFCGIALWLAMHASLRAQCAMVSLLTRKVRLPIPSMSQLDQARVFASSYEKQNVGDILRVPFMRHQQHAPELPPASDEEDEDEDRQACEAGPEFGSTARDTVPSWIRDEQVVDKLGGVPSGGGSLEKDHHDTPEHFKLMAQAMEDWWMYDVYARITMLYGVMCFLYAVSYYSIGTTISELRGFWISWSLPMLFLTAQALILRLDILQNNGQKMLPNVEFLGHIAPYFAIVGTTLEFKFWYSQTSVHLTWVFVCLAFFGHFMMALRMLDLAWPDTEREKDMPEEPTRQWWPSSWKVPSGFTKALWVLAPPKKLEPGQHCLLHEMDELKRGGASITACRRRRAKGGSDPKKGSGWATPQGLLNQCMRMDRTFQQLFNAQVWNQLTERSQQHLHDLYGEYQNARGQVDQLPDGEQSGLSALSESLTHIEQGLDQVAAKARGAVAAAGATDGPFSGSSPFSEFSKKRKPDLPWQVTRVALITMALQWFYMIIASAAEAALGPESLLKPPGEPPWIRDQKTRSWQPEMVHLSSNKTMPATYALFEATEARPPLLKSGHATPEDSSGHTGSTDGHGSSADNHGSPSGGHSADHGNSTDHGGSTAHNAHRRLAAAAYGRRPEAAMGELLKALPSLGRLADLLEDEPPAPMVEPAMMEPMPAIEAPAAFMAKEMKAKSVSWPALFEPKHLICGHESAGEPVVAALTPHGFGALVPTGKGSIKEVEAQPFALEGLGEFGPLAGAGWAQKGLELVTQAGHLLHCPGHIPGEYGAWRCGPSAGAARLPVPVSSRLLAAAVRSAPEGMGRFAALLLEHLPGSVTLVSEDADGWSPAGEVHLPPGSTTSGFRPGLAFAGEELLITTPSGEVHRRHPAHGPGTPHPAPGSAAGRREFHAACGMPGGDLARLALAPKSRPGGGMAWRPELLMPEA
uniref:Uncharacterized protein n=1 Tax=Alexandrium monilatum TaxID=311494 RepID=A0A7S4QPE5_9DINO|mmetsp:Transcript_31730/g.98978  ORF Transcript_31730/g.98978 Transcript_31730/m.98978 type:complete len:1034 (-) Transcript_31730:64-3165(-)